MNAHEAAGVPRSCPPRQYKAGSVPKSDVGSGVALPVGSIDGVSRYSLSNWQGSQIAGRHLHSTGANVRRGNPRWVPGRRPAQGRTRGRLGRGGVCLRELGEIKIGGMQPSQKIENAPWSYPSDGGKG